MVAKKKIAAATQVQVYATPAGVIVVGASAAQVRGALRLCGKKPNHGKILSKDIRVAMKFYNVAKNFFARGGRFKRRYKRKIKAK